MLEEIEDLHIGYKIFYQEDAFKVVNIMINIID